jgi:hypothetical protein
MLVQMVAAANLGITLMPEIAVDAEFASTRNVVVRPLSPCKSIRTLVLVWRQTSSCGAEYRKFGTLVRECPTGKRHDSQAHSGRTMENMKGALLAFVSAGLLFACHAARGCQFRLSHGQQAG